MSLKLGDGSGDLWAPTTRQFVAGIDPQNRYGAEWARHIQAWLFDVDRSARSWAESIVLLTATASTVWPGEDTSIPPILHFRQGLRASREARHKALERALSGRQYRAVRIYGVDSEGYLHRHNAVYVGSEVDRCTLRPWAESHRDNSPLAQGNSGDGSVRVDNGPDVDGESGVSSVGAYLMQNIPGCGTTGEQDHGIRCADDSDQMGATILDRVDAKPVTIGPVVSPASE